jgi:acetyl/propionyl-CoA carboxylase alpha subunit
MIGRLLIANRGEIAVRIARACRELGIESVAVYSDADARAAHVAVADRALPIGPAPAPESYLSIPKLIQAAQSSRSDAVHPGYGFLSENAAFAADRRRSGQRARTPPQVVAQMGSKIAARRLMEAAGVPVVPGETPREQSDEGLRAAIDRIGLPALVKASAGGGGKGMRRVDDPGEIIDAIGAARREATAAFGDGTLYVERLIERPHHVEVQVLADGRGEVVHVFERECSVQRRHQKVIEESPSPTIGSAGREQITGAAVKAARAVSYRGAGTVEFLVDPSGPDGAARFYFLEMNTRLQVEHPVTEQVVGVDLVRAQLLVASGEPLPWAQNTLVQRGHAVEARVYAEDPANGFLPQAGRLLLYREPSLPGVRVDSGVHEGAEISVHYDPLLAKVIASAETRPLAIERLASALRAYPILGVQTNIPFLLRILDHPRFRAAEIDTEFLEREASTLAEAEGGDVPKVVQAAVAAHSERASTGTFASSRAAWDPWATVRPGSSFGSRGSPEGRDRERRT